VIERRKNKKENEDCKDYPQMKLMEEEEGMA
jgi:hypothetical protein